MCCSSQFDTVFVSESEAGILCFLDSVNALEVVPELLLLLLHQLLRLELLVVAQHPQHSSPFLACIYSQWLVVYW